ncbi:MAG TPA: hypothetical protein VI384_00010 [Candidatus Dormibacteraeota bacterium]
MKRWPAVGYGTFFVLFALPFATLYAACSHQRVDTVNGYQALAPHDGTGSDGFAWIALALVVVALGLSLFGVRPLWLSVVSVAAVTTLFLAVTAAGGARASSKAEIGYWLSSVAVALAPAAGARSWRQAGLVALATVAAAAALVGAIIGLILLTASTSHG